MPCHFYLFASIVHGCVVIVIAAIGVATVVVAIFSIVVLLFIYLFIYSLCLSLFMVDFKQSTIRMENNTRQMCVCVYIFICSWYKITILIMLLHCDRESNMGYCCYYCIEHDVMKRKKVLACVKWLHVNWMYPNTEYKREHRKTFNHRNCSHSHTRTLPYIFLFGFLIMIFYFILPLPIRYLFIQIKCGSACIYLVYFFVMLSESVSECALTNMFSPLNIISFRNTHTTHTLSHVLMTWRKPKLFDRVVSTEKSDLAIKQKQNERERKKNYNATITTATAGTAVAH